MGIVDKFKDAVTGEDARPDAVEQQQASTSTDNGRWGDDHVGGDAEQVDEPAGADEPTGGEPGTAPGQRD